MSDATPAAPAAPGAGWYPDPNDPSTVRYWTGSEWTDNRAPAQTVTGPAAQAKTSGMAIASLVCGLLWGYGVLSILAIIFAAVAKKNIRESNGMQTGGGMATAGLVLGIIGAAIVVLIIIIAASADTSNSGYNYGV